MKLSTNIRPTADFRDLHVENKDGQLCKTIFHKPYYLPFNSIRSFTYQEEYTICYVTKSHPILSNIFIVLKRA